MLYLGAPSACYLKVYIPNAFAKSKVTLYIFIFLSKLGEIMSYWDDVPSYQTLFVVGNPHEVFIYPPKLIPIASG